MIRTRDRLTITMNSHPPLPARTRSRPRRTQAERTAETRRKVIEAAIECLAEEGFTRTTSSRVAARSGVTCGGIQHHFPDKEAMLAAVIDHVMEQLDVLSPHFEAKDADLESRLAELVDGTQRVWDLPMFRAYLEIALHSSRDTNGMSPLAIQAREIARRSWDRLFGDLDLPPGRSTLALRFLFAGLSGLLLEMLLTGRKQSREEVITLIRKAVLDLLRPE
jgi:AcrR family transcriptional regulator